jgi:hypothetical protein
VNVGQALPEPVTAKKTVSIDELVAAAPTDEKALWQTARDTLASIINKASAVSPFVITMDTTLAGGRRPMISGTTNLPDGTRVVIFLYRPFLPNPRARWAAGLNTCDGGCPLEPDDGDIGIEVKYGHFQAGPFSEDRHGKPLAAGTYSIVVRGILNYILQPPGVLSIVGLYGENAKGAHGRALAAQPFPSASARPAGEVVPLLRISSSATRSDGVRRRGKVSDMAGSIGAVRI